VAVSKLAGISGTTDLSGITGITGMAHAGPDCAGVPFIAAMGIAVFGGLDGRIDRAATGASGIK
jgi:hypothetical protein